MTYEHELKGTYTMSSSEMSLSKEAIYKLAAEKVIALFEVEQSQLRLDAKLYDDLDIDSIDAVDLLIEIKQALQLDLRPEQFKGASTLGDMVEIIFNQQSPSAEA